MVYSICRDVLKNNIGLHVQYNLLVLCVLLEDQYIQQCRYIYFADGGFSSFKPLRKPNSTKNNKNAQLNNLFCPFFSVLDKALCQAKQNFPENKKFQLYRIEENEPGVHTAGPE